MDMRDFRELNEDEEKEMRQRMIAELWPETAGQEGVMIRTKTKEMFFDDTQEYGIRILQRREEQTLSEDGFGPIKEVVHAVNMDDDMLQAFILIAAAYLLEKVKDCGDPECDAHDR